MKRNIVIIGGTSGIGNSVVQKLHLSDQLFVTGRVYKNLNSCSIAHFQPFDVLESTDFSWMPDTIHGLVYCPGSITLKPFARLTSEDFLSDYRINVLGAVTVIQHALAGLKKSGNSSVVLFSSVAAQKGMTFHASIAAAKAGVEGLAKSCAAELAALSIRVNVIAPSLTHTPLASTLTSSPEKMLASAQRHPLKRIGSPDETAALVSFLLSDNSKFMTGQVIGMDGGLSSLG